MDYNIYRDKETNKIVIRTAANRTPESNLFFIETLETNPRYETLLESFNKFYDKIWWWIESDESDVNYVALKPFEDIQNFKTLKSWAKSHDITIE